MRITGRDELLLCVSAKGLLTRDIVEAFAETDGAEVSAGLVRAGDECRHRASQRVAAETAR